jgi:hypothetical protein
VGESLSRPGVVKIGCTSGCPRARLDQVSRVSGYRAFAPFQLVGAFPTENARAAEARAHLRLRQHRIRLSRTGRRELFDIDTMRAVDVARMEASRRPFVAQADAAPPVSWGGPAIMGASALVGLLAVVLSIAFG